MIGAFRVTVTACQWNSCRSPFTLLQLFKVLVKPKKVSFSSSRYACAIDLSLHLRMQEFADEPLLPTSLQRIYEPTNVRYIIY